MRLLVMIVKAFSVFSTKLRNESPEGVTSDLELWSSFPGGNGLPRILSSFHYLACFFKEDV